MPLYEYQCSKCGNIFEVIQKFSDEPLTVHEGCGGEVVKLISRSAFQLKGSGWYATDYARGSSSGPATDASKGESSKGGDSGKSDSAKSDSSKSETKSETKSESKSEGKSESKSESKSETKSESKPAPASSKSD